MFSGAQSERRPLQVVAMTSLFFRAGIVAVAFSAAAAWAETPDRQALVYSPWTKICFKEICFTGIDARLGCKPVAAAVLIEKSGDQKKTLSVTLPTSVDRDRGASIAIDQAQPSPRPFTLCRANGCVADYEVDPKLMDQLTRGSELRVSGFDQAGMPLSIPLPLAGFAAANQGPPTQPQVFEESQVKLREELERRKQASDAACDPPQ
jgi:invasion protein IalB